MTQKHTPTPYKYDTTYGLIYSGSKDDIDAIDVVAKRVESHNAEFIVLACNVHEELVEVLRAITEVYINSENNGHVYSEAAHLTVIKNALDALTKACGEA